MQSKKSNKDYVYCQFPLTETDVLNIECLMIVSHAAGLQKIEGKIITVIFIVVFH